MRNEQEYLFGRNLQQLVSHLIKNAIKVPDPVLKAALDFEGGTWSQQDDSAKSERVKTVAELTEPPSDIHRHMEAYPHDFSKKRFADYLSALKHYKGTLGL